MRPITITTRPALRIRTARLLTLRRIIVDVGGSIHGRYKGRKTRNSHRQVMSTAAQGLAIRFRGSKAFQPLPFDLWLSRGRDGRGMQSLSTFKQDFPESTLKMATNGCRDKRLGGFSPATGYETAVVRHVLRSASCTSHKVTMTAS
jgi:hypothetical protein